MKTSVSVFWDLFLYSVVSNPWMLCFFCLTVFSIFSPHCFYLLLPALSRCMSLSCSFLSPSPARILPRRSCGDLWKAPLSASCAICCISSLGLAFLILAVISSILFIYCFFALLVSLCFVVAVWLVFVFSPDSCLHRLGAGVWEERWSWWELMIVHGLFCPAWSLFGLVSLFMSFMSYCGCFHHVFQSSSLFWRQEYH